MPKMKTISGVKKRFKKTANSYKFRRMNRSHILSKEPQKRKRQRRANVAAAGGTLRMIKKLFKLV